MNDDLYGDDWDPAAALEKDGSGMALRRVDETLQQGLRTLKAKLDRGVAPDEFQRGKALLESYAAASRGMEKAWKRRHKS